MDSHLLNEKWCEICFLLRESVSSTCTEKEFENHVIRAIETLGWREFRGEIKRQEILRIGRQGILRPDYVIYG